MYVHSDRSNVYSLTCTTVPKKYDRSNATCIDFIDTYSKFFNDSCKSQKNPVNRKKDSSTVCNTKKNAYGKEYFCACLKKYEIIH